MESKALLKDHEAIAAMTTILTLSANKIQSRAIPDLLFQLGVRASRCPEDISKPLFLYCPEATGTAREGEAYSSSLDDVLASFIHKNDANKSKSSPTGQENSAVDAGNISSNDSGSNVTIVQAGTGGNGPANQDASNGDELKEKFLAMNRVMAGTMKGDDDDKEDFLSFITSPGLGWAEGKVSALP